MERCNNEPNGWGTREGFGMKYLAQFPLNEPQAVVVLIAMTLGLVAGFYLDRFEK